MLARRPRLTTLTLATSALLIALVLVARGFGALDGLELDAVDARFSLRGAQAAPADVVMVDIDAATFEALDEPWPFRRVLHARLIDRLRRAGAALIAYDVQFTEALEGPDADALRAAVGRAHGRVVLAATEVNDAGETAVLGGERGPAQARRAGGERAPATGHRRREPAAPAHDPEARDHGRGEHGAHDRSPGVARRLRGRRRLDRLPRSAGDHPQRLVLARARGPGTRGVLPRQGRGRRVVRADPAGRPPDEHHRERPDVRGGDPGQRDLDGAARPAFAQPPGLDPGGPDRGARPGSAARRDAPGQAGRARRRRGGRPRLGARRLSPVQGGPRRARRLSALRPRARRGRLAGPLARRCRLRAHARTGRVHPLRAAERRRSGPGVAGGRRAPRRGQPGLHRRLRRPPRLDGVGRDAASRQRVRRAQPLREGDGRGGGEPRGHRRQPARATGSSPSSGRRTAASITPITRWRPCAR